MNRSFVFWLWREVPGRALTLYKQAVGYLSGTNSSEKKEGDKFFRAGVICHAVSSREPCPAGGLQVPTLIAQS